MAIIRSSESTTDAQTAKYRSCSPAADHPESNDAYKDLIQRDPAVCDNCFQLRYDILTAEFWRRSLGWSNYEHWTPRGDNNVTIQPENPTEGVQLACEYCGERGGKERPVPGDEIEIYMIHLSETLDSKGIAHERDVLLEETRERNIPKHQCKQDSHIFAPAVSAAIEKW